MSILIASWNILQGGGKRTPAIADALLELRPDIVSLQEYRHGKHNAPVIAELLDRLELEHRHLPTPDARTNSVLIASRFPMHVNPWHASLDVHRAVQATIDAPDGCFELFAAHLPHKREQRPYLEFLADQRPLAEQPAMILGDLNCGIPFEDSDTATFENTHLFQALLKQGWVDTWRSRQPTAREYSWVSHRGNGYRYDHCLCSGTLDTRISSVVYDHTLRESGLSDHSAMLVTLD